MPDLAHKAAMSEESPDTSSPEGSVDGEDESLHQESVGQWPSHDKTSPSGTHTSTAQQPRAVPPLQKRRRVTRACDECRRKKIKCDGKQPCTHCTVYSYDCTYDQPSNRRRNPAPQYIEALEKRLQRAETLLRSFIPDVDLQDPNFDSLVQQRQAIADVKSEAVTAEPLSYLKQDETSGSSVDDAQLQSMFESTGQLDIDERGYWDFHGGSSGAVFLRRMREQFGGLLGPETKAPFLPRPPRPPHTNIESPRSSDSPFESGLPNTLDLPTKETARTLCRYALTRACCLLRFVHGPTFYEMFDRIYDTPPENFGDVENRFLPLLYVVLAVGVMFADISKESRESGQAFYKASIDQGYKYFRAGRGMMDITDCRDIVSLQAILFMILFLQASSNLSTCYSYIGIALRSALRMGLHRNLSSCFNPIERETRRRVFWVIRKMDTYVAALLGFPRMLCDEDIDQELPLEVDDEYITKDTILPMPPGKISVYVASNAHTSLMGILNKVIKYIYPIKGVEQCVQNCSKRSYLISHAKIRELEKDLQDWLDKVPMALRPGGDGSEEMIRLQQLLRMAYAYVQMMVYRPFLHYVSQRSSPGKSLDERSYACAAAGISVSRNIVHITAEMKKRGMLIGAYWFTIYTTFFAILSLAFFVLENPDKAGSQDILADATAGRDALNGLARRSMAADRCSTALTPLFEKLPERIKRSRTEPVLATKKRSAASLNHVIKQEPRNSLDSITSQPTNSNSQPATTFPAPLSTGTATRQSHSFDNPRYPNSALLDQHARRSFQELVSPTDVSGTGTPDSSGTGNSVQSQVNFLQPFGSNNEVPDLGAMMFPSADPFAYPNQPLMEFDNHQQKMQVTGNMLDEPSISNMFYNNGSGVPTAYDSLEGQLFGPLPPYLMQNQPNADMMQMEMNGMPRTNPSVHSGLNPYAAMRFDEIFMEDNDEWNKMWGDQTYKHY